MPYKQNITKYINTKFYTIPNYSVVFYKIFCKQNEKLFYIGHTTNYFNRNLTHIIDSEDSKAKLYKIIRDYGGWNKFKMTILFRNKCWNKTHALTIEQYIIDRLRPPLNSNAAIKYKNIYDFYTFRIDYIKKIIVKEIEHLSNLDKIEVNPYSKQILELKEKQPKKEEDVEHKEDKDEEKDQEKDQEKDEECEAMLLLYNKLQKKKENKLNNDKEEKKVKQDQQKKLLNNYLKKTKIEPIKKLEEIKVTNKTKKNKKISNWIKIKRTKRIN